MSANVGDRMSFDPLFHFTDMMDYIDMRMENTLFMRIIRYLIINMGQNWNTFRHNNMVNALRNILCVVCCRLCREVCSAIKTFYLNIKRSSLNVHTQVLKCFNNATNICIVGILLDEA